MDLFDLFCTIAIKDEYSDGIKSAGESVSGFADKLKTGLATAAKVGAAAVTAASAAVTALTKSSIEQYGECEQLVGGVETLFKTSADIVQGYAANAYKTAGLSANEYMETVTSFSASLLQSLGNDTEAAAEKADLAITDMADNANKMGTSMEPIQNAYQGFAKANYTMLDNLKLGYGGTKEEMERLLKDATALSGVEYDISSYADIVDAIHVIQTEMGITGTTALEASTTIQGSISSMKSAWTNLVTGIADENADLDTLIGNFVDSVETAAGNVIPRVSQILSGVGSLVGKLAPIVSEEIPQVVTTVFPSLLQAGISMLGAIGEGIISALPSLANSALGIITTLASGISENLPELVQTVVEIVLQIVDTLIENVDMLVDASVEIILALADGLIDALPKLIEKAPEIVSKLVQAIINNAPKLFVAAGELIGKLVYGIVSNLPQVASGAFDILNTIGETLGQLPALALEWGADLIAGFINGIKSKITGLKDTVVGVAQTVKDFLGFSEPKEGPLSNFHTYAPDMMQLFADGIKDNSGLIKSAFHDSLDFGTASVDFGSSGLGMSSAGIINSVSSGFAESSGIGNATFVLQLENGAQIASWLLSDLIKAGAANGTPIASGQYA